MVARPPDLSTAELAARRGDPQHAVVDVRPLAAYNGWRLGDEPRGGHIAGARSLPMRWLSDGCWESTLREKGLTPDRPITVYGYDTADAARVAGELAAGGYDDLSVYTQFAGGWAADPDRPVERLDRYEQVVSPAWVHELVRGGDPPASPDGEWVLCHVHYDDRDDYAAGHVPGAVPLDTTRLEAPEDWNRRSPDELEAALRDHGIRHDTTVVLYGRPAATACDGGTDDAAPGHLGAMRCAVIMLYAGVEDVRVLNGGLAAWHAAGFDVTTDSVVPRAAGSFGAEVPARPDLFIDTPEAKEWLAADHSQLVSVRSRAEFAGDTSGYAYISERGHIPGAILVDSGSDADHLERFRHHDQTMREYHEVAAMLTDRGVDPEKRVAFSCGTGWRSSEAFVNAYLMGWSDVAVYDGGWYEWSDDPDNPIARDDQPRSDAG